MQISEFARLTGLSRDTVRFYVRLGLLHPLTSARGGRNPYQLFTEEDVQIVEVVRISQRLGMPLKQIAALGRARREGRVTTEQSIEVLSEQLALLEQRSRELKSMTDYLRAKIMWLKDAQGSSPPAFKSFVVVPVPRP
jgi:DNA-binding transcriptional MerR regulator